MIPENATAEDIKKELFYRGILERIGVFPGAIDRIMRTVDTSGIDITQEAALMEEARTEWAGLITKRKY
jgi:hypothetical protein